MQVYIVEFEVLKKLNESDATFCQIWKEYLKKP